MWRDYWAYMRPRSFPSTFALVLTGYAVAGHRFDGHDLAWLFVTYSVLLWGGTNAFNSSQDRDEGPVNLLPDPPPLPRHLAPFGLGLMLLACGLGFAHGWREGLLVLLATALSILYSRGGKHIAGLDMLINAGGCGLGSVWLGYCWTGAPLTGWETLVGLAFSLGMLGGMPTTQIFQLESTRERNWTKLLGPRRILRLGAALLLLHLLVLYSLTPLRTPLFWAWAVLVLLSALHSWRWSASPMVRPYPRMIQEMTMMMASQVLWTLGVWLG